MVRPIRPARMPACSWSSPSCGDTFSTEDGSKASGSAPYFSTFARSRASSSVNVPSICALPSVIGSFTVGYDITLPSSTIAKLFSPSGLEDRNVVALANFLPPSPVNSRNTIQLNWFCGTPAYAFDRSVPSTTAGPRRNLFAPSRSQVISGRSGNSSCLLSLQVYAASAAWVAASGVHCSGAPGTGWAGALGVAPGLLGLAAGVLGLAAGVLGVLGVGVATAGAPLPGVWLVAGLVG